MKNYIADLHIHSVLSPCGSLDNSPTQIIATAHKRGLDIIAITDHNSLKHCELCCELAAEFGILVLYGAEITSQEEAHLLAYMPNLQSANELQKYIDRHIAQIPNNPDFFGYQVQVDADEQIIAQEENLLLSAIAQTVEQIQAEVHRLGGLLVPAHIDRQSYSVISQLGIMPPSLRYDAIELSKHPKADELLLTHKYLKGATSLHSSDAHYLEDIGAATSVFYLHEASFGEIRQAMHQQNGRSISKGKSVNTNGN